MNPTDLKRYNTLYEQHLTNLKLQGKRPATIDAYSRAVRRITAHFDRVPDTLTTSDLKQFFASLIQTHSWSTRTTPRSLAASRGEAHRHHHPAFLSTDRRSQRGL